jgi:hypothetical protein
MKKASHKKSPLVRLSIVIILSMLTVTLAVAQAQTPKPSAVSSSVDRNTFASPSNKNSGSKESKSQEKDNWLEYSFEEHSIIWFFISAVLGGFFSAIIKLIFEVILPLNITKRREITAIKQKYAVPILLATESLRNRLKNMIELINTIEKEKWLSYQEEPGYYYLSTLYLVSQLFGWIEILRCTVVYLDLNTTKDTRKFERYLELIEKGFSDPKLLEDIVEQSSVIDNLPENQKPPWIYSYELRAIGEQVIFKQTEQSEQKVLGYAFYNKKISEDSEFKKWLSKLNRLFKDLQNNEERFKRIVIIHYILNNFIEYLDPKHIQTEKHEDYLKKIFLDNEQIERIRKKLTIN